MIPEFWYAVLDSTEVPRNRPIGAVRLGEKLVFWRDSSGQVRCVRDRCSHRGASLCTGKVVGDAVACPFHGFEFDGNGRCIHIPAQGRSLPVPDRFLLPSYPVREANGFVYLWWGKSKDILPPVPFFDDIDASFRYSTKPDLWPVHYTRAIENQLDVLHLPFTHHNTIGRNVGALVDGPLVRWLSDSLLRYWVFNRHDDGTPPRKADVLRAEDSKVHLDLMMPNLWQNHLNKDVRIVVAFAPVDDHHTVLYVRFYQRKVPFPILSGIFNSVSMVINQIILNQDRRVVLTQHPDRTWLMMGENLVEGDRPIAMFRMKRHHLLEAAGLPTAPLVKT